MNKTKKRRKTQQSRRRKTQQSRRRKQMRGGYGEVVEQYIQSVHLENRNFFWERYSMLKLSDDESNLIKQHIGIINDNGCPFINENQYDTRHAGGFNATGLRGTSLSIGTFRPAQPEEPNEKELVFIFYNQIDDEEAIPIGFISCSVKGKLCLTKYECFNSIKVLELIKQMFKGGIGANINKNLVKSVAKRENSVAKYPPPNKASRGYKIKASHLLQAFYIRHMYKRGVQTIYKNPVEEAIQYNKDTGFLVFSNIDEEFPSEINEKLPSKLKELRIKELKMMELTGKRYSIINILDVITGLPRLNENISMEIRESDEYEEVLSHMHKLVGLES